MRLLVCSLKDIASVNIRDQLLALAEWATAGEMEGSPVFERGNMTMITVPRLHLCCDNIDREAAQVLGKVPDEVVFLSLHRAASGKRSLTVHPIGNWGPAKYGGKARTVVASAPHLMSSLLRRLRTEAAGLDFEVTFEVTHHGPYLETPTLFIEIGSSEATWGDREAAQAIARSLLDVTVSEYPVAMGIGGGHYAPRFTDSSLAKQVNFGHMLPSYALDLSDREALADMIRRGMERSGASVVYVHKKSMNRSEVTTVCEVVASLGYRTVDGSDLERIAPSSAR